MLRFQSGDEAAFDDLVREHQQPVQAFLFRYSSDRGRTEDLTQEVFLRVYQARYRYRPEASFKTWILTIATRLALNEIRGIRRRRRVFAELQDPRDDAEAEGHPMQAAIDTRESSPVDRAIERELGSFLDDCILRLPEKQRAALLLSRTRDLSYREIAAALDLSVLAVKSLLTRARETLRTRLNQYRADPPELREERAR